MFENINHVESNTYKAAKMFTRYVYLIFLSVSFDSHSKFKYISMLIADINNTIICHLDEFSSIVLWAIVVASNNKAIDLMAIDLI